MVEQSQDPYAALKSGSFWKFLVGKLLFTISLQIQGVVVGWQVYELTADPLALGMIGLAEAIPSLGIALFAGHIADNFNKKKIICLALATLVLCSMVLLVSALELEYFLENKLLFLIYGAIFISGFARGFLGPAQFSILPLTLPDKTFYKNAVSWNSTIWQTSQVLGPVLGGYLFAWFGLKFAYLADMVLLMFSVLVFLNLRLFQPEARNSSNKLNIFESMKEGLSFIKNRQEILGAMTLDLFAVLFGGAVALLPIFADEVLQVGPKGLGYLRMSPALGSILMMVIITYFPVRKNAGKIMILSVGCFGLCMIGFAFSEVFALSLFLLALSGAFDAVSVVTRQTLMQTLTPDHLKGRVSSVNNIFVGSSNEIGSFESGLAAKIMGLVPSVVFGGSMTILIAAIAYFRADKLRKVAF